MNPYDWVYYDKRYYEESGGLLVNQDTIAATFAQTMHGFVYKITHVDTGKFYIGKKKFKFKVTKKPLKGKKRKRISYEESDWIDYFGSSEDLQKDVARYGKDQFIREIISFHNSQWDLTYAELKKQLEYDVMSPTANSYNGIINVRLRKFVKKSNVISKYQ